jgi:glutamate synthase domain-containing protein 3
MTQLQVVHRTAARRKFGGYKPDKPKIIREVKVEETETFRKLKQSAAKSLDLHSKGKGNYAHNFLRHLDYSAEDVERLSIALADFESHESFRFLGDFLATAVRCGQDSEYVIHASHLKTAFSSFGPLNISGKHVEFFGSADTICNKMSGGSLIIHPGGSRIKFLGAQMKGGSITIIGESNVGNLGIRMHGGEIIFNDPVNFNEGSGWSIGDGMSAGRIHFKKDCHHSYPCWSYLEIGRQRRLPFGGRIDFDGKIIGAFRLSNEDGRKEIYHKGKKMVGRWEGGRKVA